MKSFLFIIISSLSLISTSYAQNIGKITGIVKGQDEKAGLPTGATVSVLKVKDSAAVKLSVTGKDGVYSFENIANGKYFVSVSLVGYKKSYSKPFEINAEKPVVAVPAMVLTVAPKALSGVTVVAKRPLVEQKIDRMIVNVEASVSNLGTSALDVLEKSPGITVDNEGNISLKGKEGVLIMIDGRPSQLSGAELAALLRNMSANQMDQVEIMTNPPARYDAAGNAGVINIKTKKNISGGYNGSLSAGVSHGRYAKTNEGFNFNYRQSKVNVFTNLSHNYSKNFSKLTIQRNLRNTGNSQLERVFDQQSDKIMFSNAYNAKVGLDYFVNKKTTLGIVLNGSSSPSEVNNLNTTNILSPLKQLESITKAEVNNTSNLKSFSTNVNFRTLLDTKGKELTADFDYATYNTPNSQFMSNAYFNVGGGSIIKSDTLQGALPQDIKIYGARVDYLHPLKKGARLEAGLKSSIVKTDNDAGYDSVQYGLIVHDFNRSNHFVYEENINAAYVNLSTPVTKKISAQLGLRLENTVAKGNQLTTGEKFERNYTQLFPTAYFQYKANEKNNFGLNFGRRIRRPNYQSLNPFIRFMDRYTYSEGNPNLKPQFSNNIEATHSYKTLLTTTLNYTATTDIIQGVIEQKGQEAYSKPANIASMKQFGIAFNLNNQVTKWWNNALFFNVFNNNFKGLVNNAPIAFSATSFALNATQQFTLSKTLAAELSGVYRGKRVEGVNKVRPMGMVTAGLSKQVLKNKGSIRLTVRDIFYTVKYRTVINYGNVDAAFQESRDTRVVNLGFSYRFSKGKAGAQKKRINGSANDEQDRINVE